MTCLKDYIDMAIRVEMYVIGKDKNVRQSIGIGK